VLLTPDQSTKLISITNAPGKHMLFVLGLVDEYSTLHHQHQKRKGVKSM